jgi:hypothetical protein
MMTIVEMNVGTSSLKLLLVANICSSIRSTFRPRYAVV